MPEPIHTLTFKFRWLKENGLKAMRKAARKAGELIRDEASRLAPVRRGLLRDEMTMRTRKESDESIELEVGPSKKTAWYAKFVEYGTRPHLIERRKSRVLVDVGTGALFGVSASHPGIRPTPFLGPAVENKGNEAAAVYWYELNKAIDKAFDKSTAA
jgi:HK97 gp10 family phage protein